MMQDREIYIHAPSPFIQAHWHELLPDWTRQPETMVLVLLRSQFPLDPEGEEIQQEKDRLMKEFESWADYFYQNSQQQRILTEIISPKDGTPQYSTKGNLTFDSVAAVHFALGFDFLRTDKGCKVLKHPHWQTAVYPALILSDMSSVAVQSLVNEVTSVS